jgi:hypothetical protein
MTALKRRLVEGKSARWIKRYVARQLFSHLESLQTTTWQNIGASHCRYTRWPRQDDVSTSCLRTIYLTLGNMTGVLAVAIEVVRAQGPNIDLDPTRLPWVREMVAAPTGESVIRKCGAHVR